MDWPAMATPARSSQARDDRGQVQEGQDHDHDHDDDGEGPGSLATRSSTVARRLRSSFSSAGSMPCFSRDSITRSARRRTRGRTGGDDEREDAPEDERQRVGLEESDDLVGVHATWSTVAVVAGTTLIRLAGARLLADGGHDPAIGQGGDVAQGPLLGDVAEQAAHDLPRAGLRQVRREQHLLGAGQLADDRGHVLAQRIGQSVGWFVASAENDVAENRLAGDGIGPPTTAASATDG